jgi:DNA polymerase I-like protein with 3'-5' exonuclease and polymerase domains
MMTTSELPTFLDNPDPNIYRTGNYVVLDFETTNIDKGSALNENNRLVLAAWRSKGRTYHKWGGEYDMLDLVSACNMADFIVAHNAKFELQWLERCGYDIGSRPVYCTATAEWVLGGNRKWKTNLNACMERRGLPGKDETVSTMIANGVCPSDIPKSLLLKYCRIDVARCESLLLRQLRETADTRLLPVIYTRCLVIPALADIERNGLHLDPERVEREYGETVAKYTEVMEELNQLTGGINPRSPVQVAGFVYGELGFEEKKDSKGSPIRNKSNKRFPDGMPKTDESTLLSLRATTERQKRFIELRKEQAKLTAALDKNLSMFVGACREKDCMIYGELAQGRTVTHRLASAGKRTYYKMFDAYKGCQFQNLPRIYKPLFSPRHDGWLFGEADGSQLEFRVAGYLGRDETIKREVEEQYDVHTYTKDVISKAGGVAISRTEAKAHTFKPLYGGQSGTRAERTYYQAFKDKYQGLVETQEKWVATVVNNKCLETEWGFRFYWPETRVSSDGYLNVRTKVMNAPIQSFATADIIPIGLAYFWHRTRDAQMMIVNTVHDSIEAEFPPHERELFESVAVQCLTGDVYNYLRDVYKVNFDVPLGVGMVIGEHWGEPLEGEEEVNVQVEYEESGSGSDGRRRAVA